MKSNTSDNNRNYILTNNHRGFNVKLVTALPHAKRAKTLTIRSGNKKLKLNGHQINTLKKVLAKENQLNGLQNTIY